MIQTLVICVAIFGIFALCVIGASTTWKESKPRKKFSEPNRFVSDLIPYLKEYGYTWPEIKEVLEEMQWTDL